MSYSRDSRPTLAYETAFSYNYKKGISKSFLVWLALGFGSIGNSNLSLS